MFNADSHILGVIVALIFLVGCICLVIYFTRSLIAQEKILFLLIFLITVLAGTWCVDKIVAFNIHLLNDKENDIILQIMNSVVTLVLGYYLGSKKHD